MTLFVDASYFIALADPKDRWHEAATGLLPYAEARHPLHTHALVLAEVVAVVGSARGGKAARVAYDGIRDGTRLHLPDLPSLDESIGLVVRFDGGLSLSDALSIEIMRREGIGKILSFDEDFDGKGVRRVSAAP